LIDKADIGGKYSTGRTDTWQRAIMALTCSGGGGAVQNKRALVDLGGRLGLKEGSETKEKPKYMKENLVNGTLKGGRHSNGS